MHYKTEIVIDLPRARVIELFDSIDNLKHWQPGLQAIDHISGTPGEVGAKSQLHFLMGKRRVEMVETITVKNLPDEFTGTYEAKGVFNEVKNTFIDEGDKTRWISENVFEFSGIMRLVGLFFKSSFPKQSYKYQEHFKDFAEHGTSVVA